ncbi:hypothetical protein PSTG_06820 [Puccinia striiformis f. sp. tritici PST-78]|uniref:Rho-GAP domain-containing protein n=1 Tax=Puccinia striiformis f. sp. tritici PST-78 TaxID=1165861 RepID=A0A0L0VL30_9BASI|nr:hypothetical protein PSTG_06820 [Puccinia striiformis f. sp. tritici PST-78]
MLKFRFPTKRNTHEHQPISPSSSATPNSSYQLNQASTDSIDQQQPQTDDENSLPINLPPPATTTSNTQQQQQQPVLSRKIRRKSYGGLRAMLGINKTAEDQQPPPPLPSSASPTNFQHPQIVQQQQQQQQQHLHKQHRNHPSIDASSSSTSSLSNLLTTNNNNNNNNNNTQSPSSPITTNNINNNNDRPSSSSLRPFPFLAGIRRKSANATHFKNDSPHLNQSAGSNHSSPSSNSSAGNTHLLLPTHNNQKSKHPRNTSSNHSSSSTTTRVYANGSAKKAQSVDDLSQFGLLPKQKTIQPRRSEEVLIGNGITTTTTTVTGENDRGGGGTRIDLHKGLDQIGELAGSLVGFNRARTPSTIAKDENRMPPRLSNPKGMRTVYGVPIEDLYWRDGDTFPLLVDVLVELIEQKGLNQQGIYRVPGEKRVIENLQASIDERGVRGVDIWRDSYRDVHNLSGLLKLFLREIPGGVIPFDRYDRFLAVNATPDEAERTSQLQSHVRDLPLPNKILLLKLVKHFERVVEHAAANSMLAHNVAIVFAPSLFRNGSEHSNPLLSMQNIGKASAIVRHLVLNASQIFEESTSELLKQAAIETIREKKQQQHKRRSINMNLIDQQHQYQAKPQFSKSIKDDPLSLDSSSRRGSISSVITTTTNDELKKSRRGSVTIGKQKKSNNNTAQAGGSSTTTTTTSKRNPTRTNSGLCGKANKSNRHSLTNSILNSSSKPTPPTNLNLNLSSSSDSSSTHDSLLSPPLSNSKSSTSSSSSSSSSTTTPHPTLGFRHLTAKKKH